MNVIFGYRYKDQNTETQHLIPREIAQRIVEKISLKEVFKVEIIVWLLHIQFIT